MGLDVLAFGAHPDDVEIGAGATLALYASLGRRVGVVDLTRGELANCGTLEGRLEEAAEAAAVLGLAVRENLALPDRGIEVSQESVLRAVALIRRYRPVLILAPHWEDPHPDHIRCWELIREAALSAALTRVGPSLGLAPHRPRRVLAYLVNSAATPTFLVDVGSVYDIKRRALAAHRSQFELGNHSVPTPLNRPWYLAGIEGRDRYLGWLAGVEYAEGFVSPAPSLVEPSILV
ncbi:MAG: bacillithiol biosynthesis deacetylase BshB1 [Acetobacteraceae bacterium]|nr:bacillithiol biosynthesis deacetylase BshB1 [Acetobacteraceae bacterium]